MQALSDFRRWRLGLGAVLSCGLALAAENRAGVVIPPAAELVAKVRPGHPRLLATSNDFTQLKLRVREAPILNLWYPKLADRGQRLLGEPPSRYEIPDGLRLLATSRRVLERVYTLGLLHRLEGDARYADRMWRELEAAAKFPDWNPRHFLDTAEMTHALAIAYDWLYDTWSAEQHDVLRQAMVQKGLKPAQATYEGKGTYGRWHQVRHNWNQVCNGGIGMGALALAEVEPELAGALLHQALISIQLPMAEFAPDGAWQEGPGYWNYATSYNVVLLAALTTALGTDFGLAAIPGFAEAGMFPLYVTGPLGRTVNYADGGDGRIRAPHLFWLARRFQQAAYASYQQTVTSPHPLDLLWYDPALEAQQRAELPLDKYFRKAEVVLLRSAWNDKDALFIGFKAGDNKANHSNLDLGSFVLDARGVRWAVDLGADNYNLPGYFGAQRWTYYRLRAEGHNTLVLNPSADPGQPPTAAATITRFRSTPDWAFAVADLSPAYAKHARRVWRGIGLHQRSQVIVQDEIQAEPSADLWWFLHTATQVELGADKRTATLRQGPARLQARLLSPPEAVFEVRAAEPLPSSPHPPSQADNREVRKLAVHLPSVTETRLAVSLAPWKPGESEAPAPPQVSALESW